MEKNGFTVWSLNPLERVMGIQIVWLTKSNTSRMNCLNPLERVMGIQMRAAKQAATTGN